MIVVSSLLCGKSAQKCAFFQLHLRTSGIFLELCDYCPVSICMVCACVVAEYRIPGKLCGDKVSRISQGRQHS